MKFPPLPYVNFNFELFRLLDYISNIMASATHRITEAVSSPSLPVEELKYPDRMLDLFADIITHDVGGSTHSHMVLHGSASLRRDHDWDHWSGLSDLEKRERLDVIKYGVYKSAGTCTDQTCPYRRNFAARPTGAARNNSNNNGHSTQVQNQNQNQPPNRINTSSPSSYNPSSSLGPPPSVPQAPASPSLLLANMANNDQAYQNNSQPPPRGKVPLFFREDHSGFIVKGNFMTLAAKPQNVETGEWMAHQSEWMQWRDPLGCETLVW